MHNDTHGFQCAHSRTWKCGTDRATRNWGTTRGRPRATCGNKITRMASTMHGRIYKGFFKFDSRISGCSGHTTSSSSSFRACASTTSFKLIRRKALTLRPFSQRPSVAKYADARKFQERHAEEMLTIWRTIKIADRFGDMMTGERKSSQ